MAIKIIEEKKLFRLDAGDSTYVMQVRENGYLQHLYYGAYVRDDDLEYILSNMMAPFHPKAFDSWNNRRFQQTFSLWNILLTVPVISEHRLSLSTAFAVQMLPS